MGKTQGQQWYDERRNDPRWQKVRLRTLDAAGWACEDCGATNRTFHIHHRTYISGRNPWDYPPENFVAVCFVCHEKREAFVGKVRLLFQICDQQVAAAFIKELEQQYPRLNQILTELTFYLLASKASQYHGDVYELGGGI